MEQNKSNDLGPLGKLAFIVDYLQDTFIGKSAIILELNKDEYNRMISHFREIDRTHKQFKIDMSGTEIVFILDEEK